ncbi:Mediator of RNA polymerase II transcription subunit 4 [Venturia nashicola]|uniref:Mediator of RNA polymerase II transcription subunit 4 n=1 Tax=Venturia nashicola TaxID=86259 RepID=A0A4Z1P4M9_9PEZI|nr:Mediator of RNA polymerase II transcription subunit 4 [Venturia nashicola]TLD35424.1 Mediator of RNA polymerase II transcription subunit 4 [Venturia nashicola]
MDAILDERFQRVEVALNTLIDSLTTANPLVQAANDLHEADRQLDEGLVQLSKHQANHARILKLRQTTESLDNQIKSTVTDLAEIRKELLAIPSPAEPDASTRDVPFDELLAFAKNIARFTLPPDHHLKPSKTEESVIEPVAEPPADISMMNGGTLQSPTQPEPSPVQAQSQDRNGESKTDPDGRAFSKLTQEQRAFLDDAQTMPFMPWPDFDLINAGILRQVEMMIAQGVDPGTVMTAAEQAANEEDLQRQRDELDAAERKLNQERRAQQAQQKPKEPEKEFNAFAMFEDDEDMED